MVFMQLDSLSEFLCVYVHSTGVFALDYCRYKAFLVMVFIHHWFGSSCVRPQAADTFSIARMKASNRDIHGGVPVNISCLTDAPSELVYCITDNSEFAPSDVYFGCQ